MSRWTASRVREALGLSVKATAGPADAEPHFTRILTDTRTIEPGALFVALVGDRFDGHDYLDAAVAAGATGVVVRTGTAAPPDAVAFQVPDTLRALGLLARARRREIRGPVVAVTGTNGKTSTKEMLAAVLGTRHRVYATRANLNNLVGVPTTILEAPDDADALVVEAGANLPGEISRYREIIEPSLAIVTNAVQGHLEGFGSLAGVVAEKASLTEDVPLAIVGTEPPTLVQEAGRRARAVRTAALRDADLVPDSVELGEDARAALTFGDVRFTLAARGLHQADNAVRVWAVVEALNLDRAAAARALEAFALPSGRGELLEQAGLTILNDCYNANPQSFRAVIATARALRRGRRLVFLAGTMRELGEDSPGLHAEIAAALVELAPDLLGVVGDFVPALAPYAARLGDRLITAPDPLALGPLVANRLEGGEVVVLKASRGVALERILPALTNRATPAR